VTYTPVRLFFALGADLRHHDVGGNRRSETPGFLPEVLAKHRGRQPAFTTKNETSHLKVA